jgi:hypothetical protein
VTIDSVATDPDLIVVMALDLIVVMALDLIVVMDLDLIVVMDLDLTVVLDPALPYTYGSSTTIHHMDPALPYTLELLAELLIFACLFLHLYPTNSQMAFAMISSILCGIFTGWITYWVMYHVKVRVDHIHPIHHVKVFKCSPRRSRKSTTDLLHALYLRQALGSDWIGKYMPQLRTRRRSGGSGGWIQVQ